MIVEWENDRERLARYEREVLPLATERTEVMLAAYRGAARLDQGLVGVGFEHVAAGAELLHISEHTVERHREHILDKLGLRDRVAVTRYAIRRGLVQL